VQQASQRGLLVLTIDLVMERTAHDGAGQDVAKAKEAAQSDSETSVALIQLNTEPSPLSLIERWGLHPAGWLGNLAKAEAPQDWCDQLVECGVET